jgi:hypothetical protein
VVWVCFAAALATALAHGLVFRRRHLSNNQISTIANGAFAGLTALTRLYDVGLWAGLAWSLDAQGCNWFLRARARVCVCVCVCVVCVACVWRCVDIMSWRMARMIPLQNSKLAQRWYKPDRN